MRISGSVALVTGANRGIGRHITRQLLERDVKKVYATARDPELIDLPGVETLKLDITDPASVAAAAAAAGDVSLLINNAGVITNANLVDGDLDKIRLEMDTNYYGTLSMIRAFAPVLRSNGGGGAIVNVLSALSWFAYVGSNAYAATKAAAWNLTNAVRLELRDQGTLVTGVHVGAVDTEFSADYDGPKVAPAEVARAVLDGVEAGKIEIVVDEWSANVKASLAHDPSLFYGAA